MDFIAWLIANELFLEIVLARLIDSSKTSLQSLLTSRISSALFASICLAEKINSLAIPGPTIFFSLWVPPQPGIKPKETSGRPNNAFYEE